MCVCVAGAGLHAAPVPPAVAAFLALVAAPGSHARLASQRLPSGAVLGTCGELSALGSVRLHHPCGAAYGTHTHPLSLTDAMKHRG